MPDPKLIELRPQFRLLIEPILIHLESDGYRPKISNAYRSAQQQLEKVRLGYAMPGATKPGAHNWGLACDIIDRRWGWSLVEDAARFFAALGDLALAAGLTWGGAWFGAGGSRLHPTHKSGWNRWGIGWDPAHVALANAPEELRREYLEWRSDG
jgi:hypothetical protein